MQRALSISATLIDDNEILHFRDFLPSDRDVTRHSSNLWMKIDNANRAQSLIIPSVVAN